MVITSLEVVTILIIEEVVHKGYDSFSCHLILGLLGDYFICHGMPVNPVLRAPRSGCGVDRHSMTDIL